MDKYHPIPPLSTVKLVSNNASWAQDRGRVFRVGYYSRQDGLDCVWLVNDSGTYEQTTDQESIRQDFVVLALSTEDDLFGTNRPVIEPISK